MTIIAPDDTNPVRRYWETPTAFLTVDPTAFGDYQSLLSPGPDGSSFEVLPVEDHVSNLPALEAAFLHCMRSLAGREREHGVDVADPDGVSLQLEVWRGGYEHPMHACAGAYLGWCFLAGSFGAHADSGTVSVLDPRAGAEMTAVPGMPWGRHLTIQPKAGFIAVVPGWLTSTVLPLEESQVSVVVSAESLPR